jgi:hypothetical protein
LHSYDLVDDDAWFRYPESVRNVAEILEGNLLPEVGVPGSDAAVCQAVADMAAAVGLQVRDVPGNWNHYQPVTQHDIHDLEVAIASGQELEVRRVLVSWARRLGLRR